MLATHIVKYSDFVVGISITIIGLVFFLGTALWIWCHRGSQRYNSELRISKNTIRSYFTFLKANFLTFLALFFLVLAITGLAMVVTSLG